MRITSLKRFLLFTSIVALSGCDACEETPTGPSNLAVVTISGPSEVRVGERARFTAFARPLGGDTNVDVTTRVRWETSPAGRLSFAPDGTATGVSEGQTRVTAFLPESSVESTMAVNVIGAPVSDSPPPPTTPTPSAPTGELAVNCPSRIELEQRGFCSALHTVDRVQSAVPADRWESSNELVVTIDGTQIYGVNIGTSTVTATYRGLTARAQVQVIGYVDGPYNAVFTPRSNTCTFSVRPVRTGVMTIAYRNGTLEIGGERQAYAFTYVVTNRLARVTGLSSLNGFSYSMTLNEGVDGRLTGEENIQAPQGCGAVYDVFLELRQ
jgi:hypothetical protein